MSDKLHLHLFGTPQFTHHGKPLTGFVSNKARALLIYLAVTGRAHSRDALAELLWADTPATGRENLKKALSNLRRLEGVTLLEEGQQLVVLDHNHYWVDVAEFSRLAQGTASNDVDVLQQACQLYQGGFLAGFNVSVSYEFEAWALGEGTRLQAELIEVLRQLANGYAQRHRLPQAIATVRRLLQLEPWREEAHRQLMELLARSGDRSGALKQFDLCTQILTAELDVEPGPLTIELETQIRNSAFDTVAAQAPQPDVQPASKPGAAASQHNLPTPTTPLIGREREVAELVHLLESPAVRLVTILGQGGMGKTRLALAVAATLVDDYPHGVYFVPLAPLADPASIVSAIAASVGYTFQNDGRAARQQVNQCLQAKAILLVLDNAEHLLAGVDIFVEILQTAPQVRLLVTSRERLRLHSETLYQLAGLTVADAADDARSAAVQLFIQTAQRVRPTFTPTPENWPALIQICQLVGGMPLGLILAAAWVEMLTPAEIAAEISNSLDFLAADLHDLPDRQRSLQAVFATTWQRLSAPEQAAFQQLSIFRGGFTREAAQTVTGASLLTLTALNHKSLIQRTPSGRYEIHELLRQFALATLGEQLAAVRDVHSAYYCAFLQQRDADLKGARQQAALVEIEADGENVRVAWQWAVERAQIAQLALALDGLGLFYLEQSRLQEGQTLCQLAVEQLATIADQKDIRGQVAFTPVARCRFQVKLLVWMSIFHRHLGQPEAAQQVLESAQILLEQPPLVGSDTLVEKAQLLLALAEITHRFSAEQTRDLAEQSLDLYRTFNDPWRMAQVLDLLGDALLNLGLIDRSRAVREEGLALRQDLKDVRGIATSYQNLGTTARWRGNFEEAETRFRQAIAIFQQLHDRRLEAEAIYFLAGTYYHSGNFTAIPAMYEECLHIYRELNLPNEPGGAILLMLGSVKMQLGHYEAACSDLQRSLPYYSEAGDMTRVSYVWKNLGFIALAKQGYGEVQQFLQEGLVVAQASSDHQAIGEILGGLGYLALRLNQRDQAQSYLRESLQIAVDTGLILPSLTALVGVALLRVDQGEVAVAVELYALALQHGHVANSHWFDEIAGQPIATAAASLPPAVIAAAEARGQARELAPTLRELLATMKKDAEFMC